MMQIASPPWRPIPSRLLAKVLGVSLQSLANWRVRDTGPQPEPYRRGQGNRTMYRPDVVMSWLAMIAGQETEPWKFSQKWLQGQNLGSMVPHREAVEQFAAQADVKRYF